MALANYERDEHQLALKLLRELADTGTASQLARCLVEGLVRIRAMGARRCFQGQPGPQPHFELLAQASLKGGELLSSGYRQALYFGVLGMGALEQRMPVHMGHVEDQAKQNLHTCYPNDAFGTLPSYRSRWQSYLDPERRV